MNDTSQPGNKGQSHLLPDACGTAGVGQVLRTLLWPAVLALAGCTTIPADLGRSDIEALAGDRGHAHAIATPESDTASLVQELTAEPLTPESAVQITFLNNPALAGELARLGFGAAELYEAGRISNPVFNAAFLDANVAGEKDQITYGLAVSFTDLLTLSSRKRLSEGAFVALKQTLGAEVMRFAADTETRYYEYVSALQVARLRRQTAIAAELSAALTERFYEAGNVSAADRAVQRATASEARLHALESDDESGLARSALATALGLSTGGSWTVPEQLPLPVAAESDLDSLLKVAHESRLDLLAARTDAEVRADRLGVVGWTRWLGKVDLGVEHERETSGTRLTGPTVGLELPVFTAHREQQLRADAELQRAIAEVRRIVVDVDNSVRLAYAILLNARTRVEETGQVLIPQRTEAVTQAQSEANYMLTSVFELIRLKQLEYDAYQAHIEAIRDYWLQRSALALAVGNALPGAASEFPSEPIPVEPAAVKEHEHHHGGTP